MKPDNWKIIPKVGADAFLSYRWE